MSDLALAKRMVVAERDRRRGLRSTVDFAKWRNPEFEPARFHRELGQACDLVLDAALTGTSEWFGFSAPPRHGKTEEVGRCLGPRGMAMKEGFSVLYATSTEDRSKEVSARARKAVSRMYSQSRPHLAPGRTWTTTEWETEGGNTWQGIGAGTATGGIGCNLAILDDVTGSALRYGSRAKRDATWRWIEEDVLSRVVEGGAVVVMETRRGVDDVRARFQLQFPGKLQMFDWPLVYDREHALTSPVYDRREQGEYLWPSHFGKAWHDANPQIRGRLYAQLYQQRPTPDEGSLYQRQWLSHRYPGTPASNVSSCQVRMLSVDGAATHGAGDHTVVHHWGFRRGSAILLGQWRGQWDYPTFERTLLDIITSERPHGTLIENTSNGRAVAQKLISSGIPGVIPINVSGMGGKRDRIRPTLALWESKSVLLPDATHAPWVPDMVERLLRVTGKGDEVDDEADAATIALSWWQGRNGREITVLR